MDHVKSATSKHIVTPVFVWRASSPAISKIEGFCVYCSSTLNLRRISETGTEADEKLKELYRREWSAISGRLLGFNNLGHAEERVERFNNTYIPLRGSCVRCGWWVNQLRYVRIPAHREHPFRANVSTDSGPS